MTFPKPASINFDDLDPSHQSTPLPQNYGTLRFDIAGAAYAAFTSVDYYTSASQDKFAYFFLNQAAPGSGVIFSSQDGSSFGIKSLKLWGTEGIVGKQFTVNGMDASGQTLVTESFVVGLGDQDDSVHYSVIETGNGAGRGTGILTFNDAWKAVAKVGVTNNSGGSMIFGLDDIILQVKGMQLAEASDSGAKGDAITNAATPVLEGAYEANTLLDIIVDDDIAPFGTVMTDADGKFRIDTLTFKQDGPHSVMVREHGADDAGITYSFTLDTKAKAPGDIEFDTSKAVGDPSDRVTSDPTPFISGMAEAGATVKLYDGARVVGEIVADANGVWKMETIELDDGKYNLVAKQVDVAGNESTGSAGIAFTVQSGRPGEPVLDAASDSGVAGDGITNVARPTLTGTAQANAQVVLRDALDRVLGVGKADASGKWSIKIGDGFELAPNTPNAPSALFLVDGLHEIRASVESMDGNQAPLKGAAIKLEIDTHAPHAPRAPMLDKLSDSGVVGDNITNVARPGLTGRADKYATVSISDNGKLLGTAKADAEGMWSFKAGALSAGKHAITAVQADVAGNKSEASEALNLIIEAGSRPAPAPVAVDGVPVTSGAITLPGGSAGTSIRIPVVQPGRIDTDGGAATADIPLAKADGKALLTARLPVGLGLDASGAAVSGAQSSLKELIASINATGQAHGNGPLSHLTGSGVAYLSALPDDGQLLVQTVRLNGASSDGAHFELAGAGDGQQVAVVVDGTQVAAGSSITLNNIQFASVFGALDVTGSSKGQILAGDGAAQTFHVGGDAGGRVLGGGGADTLQIDLSGVGGGMRASMAGAAADASATAVTTTLLHGGSGADVARFSGAVADYTIEQHGGYVLVSSHAAPAQVAKLVNVETLQFGDAAVAATGGDDLTTLAGMYQNVLGRQADADGFSFWAGAAQAGFSLGHIAVQMISSTEGAARLGALGGGTGAEIDMLYHALFNRDADADGHAYWVGRIEQGATLEQVADEIAHSVEMIGHRQAMTDWDFQA